MFSKKKMHNGIKRKKVRRCNYFIYFKNADYVECVLVYGHSSMVK